MGEPEMRQEVPRDLAPGEQYAPIERMEAVLYCGQCERRMRIVRVVRTEDRITMRYWSCPYCSGHVTGKTVDISNTYRRR